MSVITLEQANIIIESAHVEDKKRELVPLIFIALDAGGYH